MLFLSLNNNNNIDNNNGRKMRNKKASLKMPALYVEKKDK